MELEPAVNLEPSKERAERDGHRSLELPGKRELTRSGEQFFGRTREQRTRNGCCRGASGGCVVELRIAAAAGERFDTGIEHRADADQEQPPKQHLDDPSEKRAERAR